jgi:uncharacterized protein (DUF1778 family)
MPMAKAKTERIDIRTTRAAKARLRRAAAMNGKNVSEFLLDAGMTAADEALADRRVFALDETRWRAFQKALDRPVRAKPRLAKLLSEPGVLD